MEEDAMRDIMRDLLPQEIDAILCEYSPQQQYTFICTYGPRNGLTPTGATQVYAALRKYLAS
jgi:hypothetical protein